MENFNRRVAVNLRYLLLVSVAIAFTIASSRAQQLAGNTQPAAEDRIALYQALLDLANPWTVMCVAAHPDDEDGTSLIVMRRKYGAHTVSLFSTFGEGGQNAIGPELYEELGAIRARETKAASDIQGSEPYFLGLRDFGFSKSRAETFQKWGHEEALSRMVLHIRKLRPDVIITNHSTTSNDHGHHQATALLVVEAFDAAADPKRFPEQLKNGVKAWQVQRLFVRVRGSQAPPADAQLVTIDPNERDPVRGTVFAEQALSALQKHATQGPWPKTFAEFTARFRAFSGQGGSTGQMPLIRYRLERTAKERTNHSAPIDDGFPKGSHNFLDGLRLPPSTQPLPAPTIDGKTLAESLDNRDVLFEKLVEYLDELHRVQVIDLRAMRPIWATKEVLAGLSGVSVQLIADQPRVQPGSNISAKLVLTNKSPREVRVGPVSPALLDFNGEVKVSSKVAFQRNNLPPGETKSFQLTQVVPLTATINVPHFNHLYDNAWRGYMMPVVVNLEVKGKTFSVNRQVVVDIVPPVEITSVTPPLFVITPQTRSTAMNLNMVNHRRVPVKSSINAIAIIDKPKFTSTSEVSKTPFTLAPGEQRNIGVVLPLGLGETKTEMVSITTRIDLVSGKATADPAPETPKQRLLFRSTDKSFNEVSIPIVYAHAIVAPNVRVGYLRGFDFSLPNALKALGVESQELSVNDVKTTDLSKFTSIIVDNRVYESQPELIAANLKLLDYTQAGGNLIVFYHRIDEFNPNPQRNRPQLSPFKLILGNERITDENAPISFLEPDHALLNRPNKLNQDDFKDWIQERGLYYPREWAPEFKALLQSNDPGEQPLKGGLLVADYGKGHYIYTSMVWYRQLRAGVPGAYRMLANMISYGRN